METMIFGLPVVTVCIITAVVLFVLLICIQGYVKAPPDKAIIISGMRRKPKILLGRAGIRIPFLERIDHLLMGQVTIDVKTDDYIPTLDFINIQVDAVVKVKVSDTPEGLAHAMRNFLNKDVQDFVMILQDSLQGNMREIIGTMSLKDICNNREAFGNEVQTKASVDMQKLGIEIISCNIQNVKDKNSLIEDMGMDNTAKIKKEAAIAKAEADRDVAISQAAADKQANDARVAADTEIAIKNTELAIKQSELRMTADTESARADAAYRIQEEEQRKSILISAAQADIANQERMVELREKEAAVEEQLLDATIRKKADAEKYAAEQKAMAELFRRQQQAEAEKYEEVQQAEAIKAKADADRYAQEQEALGVAALGKAEAEAIRAKGEAEAEALDKKAEAMRKMGEASVLEMFFNAYPQVVEAAAKPLANVDQIMMFGEGNSARMVEDIFNYTKQATAGIEASTGINIASLLAGFVGAKVAGQGKAEETTGTAEAKTTSAPTLPAQTEESPAKTEE